MEFQKPFVVGIAGGSASGKSTLCGLLMEALPGYDVLAIHMDDYFKPGHERPFTQAPFREASYMDDNHPAAMGLSRLSNDLRRAVKKRKHQVIIVEGLLVLWEKSIRAQLDLKLFVDCRADERIVRRLKRNMGWGLSFDEVADVYLDMVRYRHDEYVEPTRWHADLVINGSAISAAAVEMIARYVKTTTTKEKPTC
ncbi:MAG: AAA family ATPase [Oscillospiraceae bacterium]|nr:AAA family ATPase [Oscillospiraceae bacterium]